MLIWSVIVTGFGVLLNKRGTSLKTLIICINNTHSWQDLTQVPCRSKKRQKIFVRLFAQVLS
jgi:hypothetical protein